MHTMPQNDKTQSSRSGDTGTSTCTSKLVIVGTSTGGAEALAAFVGTLPADMPAPILLTQQFDSHPPSNLRLILQEHTCLPMHEITAHTPLRAGAIYVVPPDGSVTFSEGYAELQEQQATGPKPSVDLLLSSAARVYGDRVIAVLFTGGGSDGAAGAVEVKRAGGMLIVQHPQTVRSRSRPSVVPLTLVDVQADIEDLGPLLVDLLTRAPLPYDSDRKHDDVLRHILAHLQSQMGIDIRQFTMATLLHHIGTRLVLTRMPTMRAYLDFLQATPTEAEQLRNALLDLVTPFFRDPDQFAFLKRTVLPEVIARAREHDRTVRLWTVGCGTGEEAYSLAMLIADLLEPELAEWRIKLFATDRDEAALSFARRGGYPEALLTDLPPGYRDRFFERMENGYRVSKRLRQLVIFGKHDPGRDAPFPHIDLILCRNVLSLLTAGVQERILNQLTFSLFPAGYLVLGNAEQVLLPQACYARGILEGNIARCIGRAFPVGQSPTSATSGQTPLKSAPVQERTAQRSEQQAPLPTLDAGQTQSFYESLLRSLPIGMVVLDRNYRIVTANGISRRLLRLRATPAEQDFLHAAPGIPYTEVRGAIDAVFRERSAIALPEIELDVIAGGTGRFVALSISPIQLDATPPELAAISVIDITEQVLTQRRLEAIRAEQAQLVDELGTAIKRLNEVNKALLKANEELQATNEDMAVTQEELQAKLEELELTNKELQANFEELETNDEALQATNEEPQVTDEALETSNEELDARVGELQEQNALLADEQRRLTEIIERAPYSILVLRGPHLLVETLNAHYARRLQGQDVLGRPLSEVAGLFWEADSSIVRLANEVYQHDAPRIMPSGRAHVPEAPDETGKSNPVYTLVPAHAADGTVSGVIIYARDEAAEREKEADEMGQLDVSP